MRQSGMGECVADALTLGAAGSNWAARVQHFDADVGGPDG
jgi:hypothetical protein